MKLRGVILLLAMTFSAGATVVVLNDGDVLTGKITKETATTVSLKSLYGKVEIKRTDIKKLILDESKIVANEIIHKGKKYQARFLEETGGEKIYLLKNNQILRVPKAKPKIVKIPIKKKKVKKKEKKQKPGFAQQTYAGVQGSFASLSGVQILRLPPPPQGPPPNFIRAEYTLARGLLPGFGARAGHQIFLTNWLALGAAGVVAIHGGEISDTEEHVDIKGSYSILQFSVLGPQ